MSLSRAALRLITVAALRGATGSTGPTIAHNRVYDSRVDDLAPESRPSDAQPLMIVLTDEDEGEARSKQNGGPPFVRLVNLVVEFAMIQTEEQQYLEDGVTKTAVVAGYPSTDAEHEIMLDLLEYQIVRRLASDLGPLSVAWRRIARIWQYDCHRQVMNDAGVKLAARVLTLQCEMEDDITTPVTVGVDNVPAGFDLLPEPLRSIANILPAGASRDACEAIAAAIAPIEILPLDGIDFRITQGTDEDPLTMLDVSIEIATAQDTPQVVAAGGNVVINYARGTFQNLILAANVTSFSIINWPQNGKTGRLILKVTNTGAFDIAPSAWPAGFKWVNGAEVSISAGAGKIDVLAFVSGSAGAETFVNIIGQDYKA